MSLLLLVGVLLIVGVILWAISQLPWIDAGVKRIIYIVVVVVTAIWLISALTGANLSSVHLGG